VRETEGISVDVRLDALSERAVEIALSRAFDPRGLLSALAGEHPRATLLDLAAAIGRAASVLEEAAVAEGHRALAGRLHRIASAAAVDAWSVHRRGWGDARPGELTLYRRLHGALQAEET
jgi:hypothetical protein